MTTTTVLQPTAHAWPATRAEALRRLEAFLPHAGRPYAATRNEDRGPDDRDNVSVLSPYLRRRLITEEEVVRSVLARTSYASARKFIAEVCWRTYWKGALEWHPSIWHTYLDDLRAAFDRIGEATETRRAYDAATEGRTGIEPFDAWARELVDTGYLHNHARMWFASIWIFTLQLPWQLGAEFFIRNLLDGDPASNTLSWRWVAGLQTRGKTYMATRGNIVRYTRGRLDPGDRLALRASALVETSHPKTELVLPPDRSPGKALLLLHDDDMGIGSLPLENVDVCGVYALARAGQVSPLGIAAHVADFVERAFADTAQRSRDTFGPLTMIALDDASEQADALAAAARDASVERIVTPYAPVGPTRTRVDVLAARLAERGIEVVTLVRPWDRLLWPHASRGFVALADAIPGTLKALGVSM